MKVISKYKCVTLFSLCSLVLPSVAAAKFAEGWNDILTKQEASGRFDWLESCHSSVLVDMWDRMFGAAVKTDKEKIALLKSLLLEKAGKPSDYPQYLTFGKKDFTNPNDWTAGTAKTLPCKAIPPTYKVLGAITSFDLPKYCINAPTVTGLISVKDVTIGTQKHSSEFGGYTNQFTKIFRLKRNTAYPYHLQAGYAVTGEVASWKMWMDFNHDGDFSDAGELILNKFEDPVKGTFTVPTNALPGYTKIRVQAGYSGGTINPCGDFYAGEIEDFVLHVE